MNICDLLLKIGFANSKSEAKRMILGNAVKVDKIVISNINQIIKIGNGVVIRFGKSKFIKIINK